MSKTSKGFASTNGFLRAILFSKPYSVRAAWQKVAQLLARNENSSHRNLIFVSSFHDKIIIFPPSAFVLGERVWPGRSGV
jgi:hypothetical protein